RPTLWWCRGGQGNYGRNRESGNDRYCLHGEMLNPRLASRKRKCLVIAVILNREDDEGSLLSSNVQNHWRDPSPSARLGMTQREIRSRRPNSTVAANSREMARFSPRTPDRNRSASASPP